jgi:signal peptidase I
MAPSLQGQHKDIECESCDFRYRAGASQEIQKEPVSVDAAYCPICQYRTRINTRLYKDHYTNNGDRILVNKFIYDFADPQRYDVIVFKNPNVGKQNYIKRLIGLPGDNILIENGDIYLMNRNADNSGWEKKISRKPPHKLRHILQTVDDTDHIGSKLKDVGWPDRWQEFSGTESWERRESNGKPNYISSVSDQPGWLRYRHFRPLKSDWVTIEDKNLPARFKPDNLTAGRLIGDNYGYNDEVDSYTPLQTMDLGLHWVGDIGIKCWVEVNSSSGKLLLDLVEGGAHFQCEIDVATGQTKITCSDSAIQFQTADGVEVVSPTAQTNLKGAGKYRIEYVNADDRLNLWINNQLIEFDGADYTRDGIAIPKYSPSDPGDAEPAGIAAKNLEMRITRLQILRDIYYTSAQGGTQKLPIVGGYEISNLENETGESNIGKIDRWQRNPETWGDAEAIRFFQKSKGKTSPMFELKKGVDLGLTRNQDQFLPMGDNSPQSLDGRVWDGEKYVERDLLIGRALFIYWPHTLNEPIPFFPNFAGMGFIR